MKAICPISGIPFRTFDSLPLHWAVDHPIFSIPYEMLVNVCEEIRRQEQDQLENWNKDTALQKEAVRNASKDIHEAIQEHNWKNPLFRLHQTKHLVMLAFMKHAQVLVVDKGYAARPKPEIIEAYFWQAVELFSWVCTLANPQLIDGIPKYRVTQHTEDMKNFGEYIEAVDKVRTSIGNKYRSASTEQRLFAWEQAIAILGRRRDNLRVKLSDGRNYLAAKWALTMTNAPKDIWDFWYGILSSSSLKITFEGVKIGDKWEAVNPGDLRELRDWLDDNLIGPKGEAKEYHRDDTEYYFTARHTVLEIIRQHIAILEQGTSSYKIVNAVMGDNIVNATDDILHIKAVEAGLDGKPDFTLYPNKVNLIRAMATWRYETKQKLLDMSAAQMPDKDKKEINFDIL